MLLVRGQDPDRAIRAIGVRIAQLRASLRLTQEDFAERIGVSEKYVQRVESGINLSVRSLVQFANALNVPLDGLFAAPAPGGRPAPLPRKSPKRQATRRTARSRSTR